MSWPGSPRTRMRPIGPGVADAPRRRAARELGRRRVGEIRAVALAGVDHQHAGARARRRAPRAQGPTARCSSATSLPSVSPKPPGSRKSRCMSMMTSAVRAGSRGDRRGLGGEADVAHRAGSLGSDRLARGRAGCYGGGAREAGGCTSSTRRRWRRRSGRRSTRYEAALAANDVAALAGLLLGGSAGGADDDRGRALRLRGDRRRSAAAATRPTWRASSSGSRSSALVARLRRGDGRVPAARLRASAASQTQVWMRRPEGWRIVAAHVSLAAAERVTPPSPRRPAASRRSAVTSLGAGDAGRPRTRNPFGAVPSAERHRADRRAAPGTPARKSPSRAAAAPRPRPRSRRRRRRRAHEARPPRRPAGQAVEPVVGAVVARSRRNRAAEAGQLAVQRQAGHVRAADRELDLVRSGRGRAARRAAAPASRSRRGGGRPSRSIRAAEAREQRVAPGRGEQRHAARPSVGARRRRDRQAAEPEQVDEVGVGPEPRVRRRSGRRRGRRAMTKVGIDGTQSRSTDGEQRRDLPRAAPRAGRSRGRRRSPRCRVAAPDDARGPPDAPRRGRARAAARPPRCRSATQGPS